VANPVNATSAVIPVTKLRLLSFMWPQFASVA
jgi:hypothetical protein